LKYPPRIPRLLDEIETKFQRLPPIFNDGHSNGTIGKTVRCDRKWNQTGKTGSGNTKKAAIRLKVLIYQLVDKIGVRFPRKTYVVGVQQSNGATENIFQPKRT